MTVVGYKDGGSFVKIADPADEHGVGDYWMSADDLATGSPPRGYSG